MESRRELDHPAKGWILYDGDCGVCSHWVPRWRTTLSRLGLEVAPLQSAWVEERTGLAHDALLTDLRLLRNDGSIIAGADVYRYVMRRVWWAYPLYLVSVVPGFRQVFDWGYRTFAQHRMRISASCGIRQ